MYSFSYLEPVCCSMSSSKCCLLTCIQVSQEAGQVVWYSHLFKNFPQFIVIHTVKGFGIVSKAELDVFLELSCFFNDPGLLERFRELGGFWAQATHLLACPWYTSFSAPDFIISVCLASLCIRHLNLCSVTLWGTHYFYYCYFTSEDTMAQETRS